VPYLLNIIYLLLIILALPWLLWQSLRKGKYREGYAAKFLGLVPKRTSSKSKCIWLHAVSVGEVNLLAPLLKMIEQQRPEWECVISTTTTTGMALAKKKYPKNMVFYCPLDFTWAVGAAMRRIRPDMLVLAELELWPNLVRAAKRRGAKVAIINGRLGEKSFRGYRRIRPLVAGLMRQIDLFAVQDETYASRFLTLGARPETVHVTGSMKYDGAQTDRNNPATQRLAALAGFSGDDIVLLGGSTQEPEEAMLLETFRALSAQRPRLRLVLVPRHPDRFEAVAKLLDASGIAWQRRTALDHSAGVAVQLPPQQVQLPPQQVQLPHQQSDTSPLSPRVLLVDVVGELGAWWGTAHLAFVGGSMGSRGGQNMIEPAAYGAAVSFGPNTWNFRDIVATILDHNAALVVENDAQFLQFVRRCLDEPEYAAALGQRAQSFVLSQIGATQRTLDLMGHLVERKSFRSAGKQTE
jgi:3-deoxy-D-manno-octulosonic-acid transferase